MIDNNPILYRGKELHEYSKESLIDIINYIIKHYEKRIENLKKANGVEL